MQETIFGLATGSVPCAVAIVRVSGPAVGAIAIQFCRTNLTPREARYCHIHDPLNNELIDIGLVLYFEGPASFTGEDSLEFQVHGSRAVITRLMTALGRVSGARVANRGEFIRRAFENGKLSLTSVEGVAELIDAKTEYQRRQALVQAGGGLSRKAESWREMLLEALALTTAEIDFADEGEAPREVVSAVKDIAKELHQQFRRLLADGSRGEVVRHGFRVVLCGPPNAGKSTLMNTLAQRDVAIVTEHAGTTRDILEVQLDLDGIAVVLCDTAGVRDTSDPVEAIGIARTREAINSADLAIWLTDSDECPPWLGPVEQSRLIVASKCDRRRSVLAGADLSISSHTGEGVDELIDRIRRVASDVVSGEPALMTNARQRACIESASRHAERVMSDGFSDLEFVAEDLMACSQALQELVGQIGSEDVLGTIFTRFCMGK